ncbi:unnamed protein product, partial [marine sediment metagenome]
MEAQAETYHNKVHEEEEEPKEYAVTIDEKSSEGYLEAYQPVELEPKGMRLP